MFEKIKEGVYKPRGKTLCDFREMSGCAERHCLMGQVMVSFLTLVYNTHIIVVMLLDDSLLNMPPSEAAGLLSEVTPWTVSDAS
jgi:hypothetical protein